MKKQISQKWKKTEERPGNDDAFIEEQLEKKYRSLKKIKRDKPPHKKWDG
ncbi:MAG: hypothetical protein OEM01_13995 [Desulfobulbaceae bacterium]|nr:hypothetical protein [Desulfobulbaceae bacterium]